MIYVCLAFRISSSWECPIEHSPTVGRSRFLYLSALFLYCTAGGVDYGVSSVCVRVAYAGGFSVIAMLPAGFWVFVTDCNIDGVLRLYKYQAQEVVLVGEVCSCAEEWGQI